MHLEEDNKHLTTFRTPFGVFEWNVVPMGVKVGPQEKQVPPPPGDQTPSGWMWKGPIGALRTIV